MLDDLEISQIWSVERIVLLVKTFLEASWSIIIIQLLSQLVGRQPPQQLSLSVDGFQVWPPEWYSFLNGDANGPLVLGHFSRVGADAVRELFWAVHDTLENVFLVNDKLGF